VTNRQGRRWAEEGAGGGMGAAANGSRIMGAAKSVEKKVNKKTCSEFNTF